MNETERTLAGQIAKFIFLLLAFLGVKAITEVLDEIVAQAKTFDPDTKPVLKEVGDSLFDALGTGGQLIPDVPTKSTFEKWVAIIKTGFDAIEGGAGAVIGFFESLIAGHKAKVAAEKAG